MNDSLLTTKIRDLTSQIRNSEAKYIALIKSRLGIAIKDHQLRDLYKTIQDGCHKFDMTPEQYLYTLLTSSDSSPYLEHMVTGITIGETYFFRDDHQMQLLQNTVLPSIIKNKQTDKNLSIRIWSAGCASGEEIYTIAMLLRELLPNYAQWKINLLGSDLNTLSLRKAMNGVYSEWSMRSIPDYYKNHYFKLENRSYILHESIRNMANFIYLNLNDDSYPSMFNNTNAQDLILCRNVLIYFDATHINRLMQKLSASLVEGGFLLLGASDPINIKNTPLSQFKKECSLLQYQPQLSIPVKNKDRNAYHVIDTPAKVAKKLIPSVIKPAMTSVKSSPQPLIDKVKKLLEEAKWHEVLKEIDTNKNDNTNPSYLFYAKAMSLANLGDLAQANKTCQESLAIDPTNTLMHFALAMILTEQNRQAEAEKALRKTLYLDHQFVAAHFQLGLLLLKNKQTKEGLKCLNNALSITLNKNPHEFLSGFKGLDYARLAEILKREIELHSSGELKYGSQDA